MLVSQLDGGLFFVVVQPQPFVSEFDAVAERGDVLVAGTSVADEVDVEIWVAGEAAIS